MIRSSSDKAFARIKQHLRWVDSSKTNLTYEDVMKELISAKSKYRESRFETLYAILLQRIG